MANELKLPEIGENITQGTVTKILVNVGDAIKKGQNILELETDKAVVEIPSKTDGIVSEILIKAGMVVKVGQPVFTLSGDGLTAPSPAPTAAVAPIAAAKEAAPTQSIPTPAPVTGTRGVFELNLPTLGENIEKGTITKVLVKAGDVISKGQNILELETDKAVVEIPSPSAGLIQEVLVKAGTVIKVGQPVFKIDGVANVPAPAASVAIPTTTSPAPTAQVSPTEQPKNNATSSVVHVPVRKDIAAAPSVRLLARELGIDIGLVPGTGPGGRISADDVKAYCKILNTTRPAPSSLGASAQALPNFTKWGIVRREPMNNVRKKTAEHLSYAWATIPHVTQFDKADITELEKLRKRISTDKHKVSITPFLIKVIAAALKQFPQFNTSVDMISSEIIYKDYINIGVAVDTDRGLIVPVLKNVDRLSILQISEELGAIAQRARDRKTSLEELQGGCFTISNLGGIGGTHFTPIVNSPEVAILGVSRGVMEQVYADGQFVPRLMLPLSLSYDHRIIDGADGARFIRWVADAIQQPFLLDLNK